MSIASATMPCLFRCDLGPLREAALRVCRLAAVLAQVFLFAFALWLLASGPGFLADHASTVPAHLVAGQ